MRNYAKDLQEFYDLVLGFYSLDDGLYPIATKERLYQAVNEYLETKPITQIHFDSFDREEVRKIIEPTYQIL